MRKRYSAELHCKTAVTINSDQTILTQLERQQVSATAGFLASGFCFTRVHFPCSFSFSFSCRSISDMSLGIFRQLDLVLYVAKAAVTSR